MPISLIKRCLLLFADVYPFHSSQQPLVMVLRINPTPTVCMEVHLVPKKLMPQETILDGHMSLSTCPRMSKSMDDVVIDLRFLPHCCD